VIRIVFNKLLGGWYVVRGPHQAPISGRFDTKAAAAESLRRTPWTSKTSETCSINITG
jgi:hypothetical protein